MGSVVKKPYYLVRRRDRLTQGKPTYYCRFRDLDGSLLAWRSTGATSKTAAERWAIEQIRGGAIAQRSDLTLSIYTRGWWVDSHAWVRARRARGVRLSPTYLQVMEGYTRNHVMPVLGEKRLSDLTPHRIEQWLLSLLDKGLSAATGNHCLKALRIVLEQATREGLIQGNPARSVQELAGRPAERGVLSAVELRALFDERTFDAVWRGDRLMFSVNLTAAATGCRMGELQGLMVGNIRQGYLLLSHTWDRKGGLREGTKTGAARIVPIPGRVQTWLDTLVIACERDALVFERPGKPGLPIEHTSINSALYRALQQIGITDSERRERRIVFHSFRHGLATALRAGRVTDALAQAVTGHRTQQMLDLYGGHFDTQHFAPVLAVQEQLVG